ncbi:MAG: hypothetical protein SNJ70_02270 [Armatimonadota bacterium]
MLFLLFSARCCFSLKVVAEKNIGSVYIPSPGIQEYPAIAQGDNKYLVVWQDNRSGTYDIYGMFVNSTGSPITSTTESFLISTQNGLQSVNSKSILKFFGMEVIFCCLES